MSKKYSSFPQQQLINESWRQYVEKGHVDEGFFDSVKSALGLKPRDRTPGRKLDIPDEEEELAGGEETGPEAGGETGDETGASAAAAPAPPSTPESRPGAAPTGGETYMPISGTEFATMNFLVDGQLLDIIRKAAMTGVAAKDPESKNLLQLFNKEFFPALIKMTKNPNIDIAEGINLDEFLLEMLNEAEGAMTPRQQAAMKGKLRARGGMKNYLKAMGGKPPIIARNISRALTKALTQKANADALLDAAAEVSSTIKDPKAKKQYEDRYLKSLEKAPEKRVANYKDNVAAFVGAVTDLASKAAATALGSGDNFQADKNQSRAQARTASSPVDDAPPSASVAASAPRSTARTPAPRARRSRFGSDALARTRARATRRGPGIAGITRENIDKKKTLTENTDRKWKVGKDGSVTQVNNEEK